MTTKSQIIKAARALESLIEDYYTDVDHWNRVHDPADRIELDPHGTLGRMAQILEEFVVRIDPPKIIDVESTLV
jgi:hypothetical protein